MGDFVSDEVIPLLAKTTPIRQSALKTFKKFQSSGKHYVGGVT